MDSASPHAQDRVLVVEDEPGVGELLCRLLAGFGYSSQLAANADDAMQRMLSTRSRSSLATSACRASTAWN
jgi:CheY-like chemotaxis protein